MNKNEFKSTFGKLSLSEKFKENAKAQLIAQAENTNDNTAEDSEERITPKVIRLDTVPKKKPAALKAVIGTGAAAAVIGLTVWGGISLSENNPLNPNEGSSSVTTTLQSTYEPETAESTTDFTEDILADDLSTVHVTFPPGWEYNAESGAFGESTPPCVFFDMKCGLPDGWTIAEGEKQGINSTMSIHDSEGSNIGTIGFCTYDIVDDMTHEDENYYRMVYNQLMNSSRIDWANEFEIVKQNDKVCTAVCKPRTADGKSGCGILAHSDSLRVHIYISITADIEPSLAENIAKSVTLTENREALADHFTQDYFKKMEYYAGISEGSLKTEDFNLYPAYFKDGETEFLYLNSLIGEQTAGTLYILQNGRLYEHSELRGSIELYRNNDSYIIIATEKASDGNMERQVYEFAGNSFTYRGKLFYARNDSGFVSGGYHLDNDYSDNLSFSEFVAKETELLEWYNPVTSVYPTEHYRTGDSHKAAGKLIRTAMDNLTIDTSEYSIVDNNGIVPTDNTAGEYLAKDRTLRKRYILLNYMQRMMDISSTDNSFTADDYGLYPHYYKDGDTEFLFMNSPAGRKTVSETTGSIYIITKDDVDILSDTEGGDIKLYKKGSSYLIQHTFNHTGGKICDTFYLFDGEDIYYHAKFNHTEENGEYTEGGYVLADTMHQNVTYSEWSEKMAAVTDGYELIDRHDFNKHIRTYRIFDIAENAISDALDGKPVDESRYSFIEDGLDNDFVQNHIVKLPLCKNDGMGHFSGVEDGTMLNVVFNLPHTWKLDGTVASINGIKAFELFVPFPTITDGNYRSIFDNERKPEISGEKIGGKDDPYRYYVKRSTPDKYSDDGMYDVHCYVVNCGEYDIMLSFVDNGDTNFKLYEDILRTVSIHR